MYSAPAKKLPVPGEVFEIGGHTAFLILPSRRHADKTVPWVWYAPTLPGLPGVEERWMFDRFLEAGIAIGGVDVGESYGSAEGRAVYSRFYDELVGRRGMAAKACLLARSRGGLMLYNWAAEHSGSVACIAGIYPVCDLRSWPGLARACGAYGMTEAELAGRLDEHNPVERLAPLAEARVPIFHIHGDSDTLVPLEKNSGAVARRYRRLGGSMELEVPKQQGHSMWTGFFLSQKLVDFVIANAASELDLSAKVDPLAKALLEERVAVGFVVGIVKDGARQVLAYGEKEKGSGIAPDGETVYEIGSLSKVFTGVLLALRGADKLDDPVQDLLPEGVRMPVFGDTPVTLAHLSEHSSGLPRLPDNMKPVDPSNPYADYTVDRMYAFLKTHELRRAPGTYEYSNFGAGLLGHLLSCEAGTTYEKLLVRSICGPLHMNDTRIELTDSMRRRLAPPYDSALKPDANWDIPTLAGAGGIRSTVNDMIAFVAANLAEGDTPLTRAMRLAHRKRHDLPDGRAMALGWHIARDGITRFHSGMTGGYHSWLAVVPSHGIGVVVLSNTATYRISGFGEQVTRIAFGIEVTPPAKKRTVEVDPTVLKRYAGVYRVTPGFALTVTVEGGRLMVQATGQAKFPVYAESETTFFYKVVDAQITFVPNDKGAVDRLVLRQAGLEHTAVREASDNGAIGR